MIRATMSAVPPAVENRRSSAPAWPDRPAPMPAARWPGGRAAPARAAKPTSRQSHHVPSRRRRRCRATLHHLSTHEEGGEGMLRKSGSERGAAAEWLWERSEIAAVEARFAGQDRKPLARMEQPRLHCVFGDGEDMCGLLRRTSRGSRRDRRSPGAPPRACRDSDAGFRCGPSSGRASSGLSPDVLDRIHDLLRRAGPRCPTPAQASAL